MTLWEVARSMRVRAKAFRKQYASEQIAIALEVSAQDVERWAATKEMEWSASTTDDDRISEIYRDGWQAAIDHVCFQLGVPESKCTTTQ